MGLCRNQLAHLLVECYYAVVEHMLAVRVLVRVCYCGYS